MNTLTLEKHCWAEIDLTALRENYEYIRRTVGGPVCAVVKADAYGHGAVPVARALRAAGADMFAVALIEEGIELREAGITSSPAFCRMPVLRASRSAPSARGGTCAAAASQHPS